MTPDGLKNFQKYVFFPKFLRDPQMMEILFPDSIDELKAQDENEIINEEQMPQVAPTDNHEQHLMIHRMAKNTWAKWIHIQWHEEMLSMQKQQQMMQAQQQMQGEVQQGAPGVPPEPNKPQVGVAGQKPMEAAASLRGATQQSIQNNPITK
jgi:hypothetical protein